MDRFAAWWGGLPRRNQMLTVTLGGIVIGVLLIATGIALLQLVGAGTIAFTLLVARAGERFPDAGWTSPRTHYPVLVQDVHQRIPGWLWPISVLVLVSLLAVVLLVSLLIGEEFSTSMLGNLGKGVVALAMIATLALWNSDLASLRKLIDPRARSESPLDASEAASK